MKRVSILIGVIATFALTLMVNGCAQNQSPESSTGATSNTAGSVASEALPEVVVTAPQGLQRPNPIVLSKRDSGVAPE